MSGHGNVPELDTAAATTQSARPYRSHKVPACDRCRKRKIRCIVEVPGKPCLLCQVQGVVCTKTKEGEGGEAAGHRSVKRRRIESTPQTSDDVVAAGIPQLRAEIARQPIQDLEPNAGEKEERRAMIVGPAAAEDVHIIEEYMTAKRSPEEVRDGSYNVISNDPAKPILYLSVPARRKGLHKSGDSPGAAQREIIEQILGPWAPSLISL